MKVIRYQICTKVDNREEFSAVTLDWNEVNEAVAKAEAYEGVYTVEEDGRSAPAPTEMERMEAQIAYTAMMTDTLLEG